MVEERQLGEVMLPMERLRRDGGTQLRRQMSAEATMEYAEAIGRGEMFPPVVVFDDGIDFWLSDGFHRYDAHAAHRLAEILCDVREGTRRDAVLYSATANDRHGVRVTPADRELRVMALVREFPEAGVMDVVRMAGMPQSTVSTILKRVGYQLDNSKGGPKPKTQPEPTPIERALADVPDEQREAIEGLLTAPLVPADRALEAAQNVAAMADEQRQRVSELAASDDPTDKSAAIAMMRGLPYVNPSSSVVSVCLDDLRKCLRSHRGSELEGAFLVCIQHLEGLLESIESYERRKTDVAA